MQQTYNELTLQELEQADLEIQGHGSVVSIWPHTDLGRQWIDDNIESEGWQWLGPKLCIDLRFAGPIIEGAMADGLEVVTDLAAELAEYGAWDDEELSNRAENEARIVWIAAGNITEGV